MLWRLRNGMPVDSVSWSLFSSTAHRRYPDLNHVRHPSRLRAYSVSFQKDGVNRIARWAIWSSRLLLGFRRRCSAEHLGRRLATNNSRPRSRSGHCPSPTPPTRLRLSVSRKSHALVEAVRAVRLKQRSTSIPFRGCFGRSIARPLHQFARPIFSAPLSLAGARLPALFR